MSDKLDIKDLAMPSAAKIIAEKKIDVSDKIKNILNETYKLEIEIKSNAMLNKNVLLKKLLIDICTLANA